MNQIYKLFEKHKILLKNLKRVDLNDISSKRTISAYFGVDTKGFYEIVLLRQAKSRLLKKEAEQLNEICAACEVKFDTAIKKRVLFYNSEICSKSLAFLDQNGWKCYDFM